MTDTREVVIRSRDYWFKLVEMLQQNWAIIEDESGGVTVWFIEDASGVFDKLTFESVADAKEALSRNGFTQHADDARAQKHIAAPEPPFKLRAHINGPIYSSGRFWKS